MRSCACANTRAYTPALTPQAAAAAGGNKGNFTSNVNITNNRASDDQNGRAAAREVGAIYAQPGRQ